MVGEVVVGVIAHSLALISDAGQMLTDAASLVLALAAIRIAAHPARGSYTYGFKRVEIFSAQAGVVVNVAAAWSISRANRSSLNVEGAFQHILNDLYAFLGTAIAGAVVLLTGFTRADAIAALLVAGLMTRAGWNLVRESGRVLLEAAPEDVHLSRGRSQTGRDSCRC